LLVRGMVAGALPQTLVKELLERSPLTIPKNFRLRPPSGERNLKFSGVLRGPFSKGSLSRVRDGVPAISRQYQYRRN
jgi:hypothetical protein